MGNAASGRRSRRRCGRSGCRGRRSPGSCCRRGPCPRGGCRRRGWRRRTVAVRVEAEVVGRGGAVVEAAVADVHAEAGGGELRLGEALWRRASRGSRARWDRCPTGCRPRSGPATRRLAGAPRRAGWRPRRGGRPWPARRPHRERRSRCRSRGPETGFAPRPGWPRGLAGGLVRRGVADQLEGVELVALGGGQSAAGVGKRSGVDAVLLAEGTFPLDGTRGRRRAAARAPPLRRRHRRGRRCSGCRSRSERPSARGRHARRERDPRTGRGAASARPMSPRRSAQRLGLVGRGVDRARVRADLVLLVAARTQSGPGGRAPWESTARIW